MPAAEDRAAIKRFAIVLNHAVDAVANGAGEHFAVGDVALAETPDRADPLDAESQIRAGALDVHLVRFRA